MSSSSSSGSRLVGPRREVVGEHLDPLFDGATRFAQPTVIPDQAAIAHPVDHGGELRCREVVDRPNFCAGMPMSRAKRT